MLGRFLWMRDTFGDISRCDWGRRVLVDDDRSRVWSIWVGHLVGGYAFTFEIEIEV